MTPVDFLAGTASKWLMGPTGVGYLYLADDYLGATPPNVGWMSASNVDEWDVRHCELHDSAGRFQGGIPNLVGIVGALAGVDLLNEIGRPFIERRVNELTQYLLDALTRLGVDIWTPLQAAERAGIVFFRIPEYREAHLELRSERIYCGSCQLQSGLCPHTFCPAQGQSDPIHGSCRRRPAAPGNCRLQPAGAGHRLLRAPVAAGGCGRESRHSEPILSHVSNVQY